MAIDEYHVRKRYSIGNLSYESTIKKILKIELLLLILKYRAKKIILL